MTLQSHTVLAPMGPATAIELDTAEREVEVPDDLAAALEAAGARAAFDALTFTRRKELARGVSEAKRPETRERRVAAAVAEVSGVL